MTKNALQTAADDIASAMVREMTNPQGEGKADSVSMLDLLLDPLAEKVAALMTGANPPKGSARESRGAKSRRAETSLARSLASHDSDDDDDDDDDDDGDDDNEVRGHKRGSFPNLKYAKPKYKNVESILKYIERDEDRGGVKLVIMNFND